MSGRESVIRAVLAGLIAAIAAYFRGHSVGRDKGRKDSLSDD